MPAKTDAKSDDVLLIALACGATVEKAASQAGVSVSTVKRRLGDPAFRTRLRGVRSEIVERATGILTASAMESAKTLLELQKASTAAAVRLGAARSVLEMGMKLREVVDIEERLSALEQRLGGVA